jgi:hypothetical protein
MDKNLNFNFHIQLQQNPNLRFICEGVDMNTKLREILKADNLPQITAFRSLKLNFTWGKTSNQETFNGLPLYYIFSQHANQQSTGRQ